jgi:hypothetical protein
VVGHLLQYTLYSRDDDHHAINSPVAVSVYDSEDLFFVNNVVDNEAAVLNRADAQGENSATIEQKVKGEDGGWGLAVSDDNVYFTTDSSELWGP